MIELECKHKWATLLARTGKKVISTCLRTCLECGLLKIGRRTIRISRSRLHMGDKPIYSCSRGTGAGLRALYAGDETEKSVSGITETEAKFFRMVINTDSGRNYARVFFVGEARVSGGTGHLRISMDGAPSVIVWTFTNTIYAHQEGFVDVTWTNKTVHTVSVRLVNSGAFITFNRTFEVYAE